MIIEVVDDNSLQRILREIRRGMGRARKGGPNRPFLWGGPN
jgi:hypothetical protein